MYSNFEMTYNSYLMHHGTKGMKWGVRRTTVRRALIGAAGMAISIGYNKVMSNI